MLTSPFAGCHKIAEYPAASPYDATTPVDSRRSDLLLRDGSSLDTQQDQAARDIFTEPCQGSFTFGDSSANEPSGEYLYRVTSAQAECFFSFQVAGAGGGYINSTSANPDARGGHGGRNSFTFRPGVPGVLVMVVGGGGDGSSTYKYGGSGGGASSVLFDPEAVADRTDAFILSIAGGGGGEGASVGGSGAEDGGDGNGDGAGQSCGCGVGSANGKGACSVYGTDCGGSCDAAAPCQGGRAGHAATTIDGSGMPGGFGKGAGRGGSSGFGAGGGGGYGGASGCAHDGCGGGGGGKVFDVDLRAELTNTTDTTRALGGGGRGGAAGRPAGDDGSVSFSISP